MFGKSYKSFMPIMPSSHWECRPLWIFSSCPNLFVITMLHSSKFPNLAKRISIKQEERTNFWRDNLFENDLGCFRRGHSFSFVTDFWAKYCVSKNLFGQNYSINGLFKNVFQSNSFHWITFQNKGNDKSRLHVMTSQHKWHKRGSSL